MEAENTNIEAAVVEISTALVRIPLPDLANESSPMVQQAEKLTIDCVFDLELAGDLRKALTGFLGNVESHHRPILDAINRLKDVVLTQQKRVASPAVEALAIVNRKITAYRDEEDRRIAEANRKAQAEAKARAEEAALSQAIRADEAGAPELANSILDNLPTAPVFTAPPVQAAKVKGMADSFTYSAILESIDEACRGVIAGKVPKTMLTINQTAANQQARSLREEFDIPGFRLIKTRYVRGTRSK